MNKSGNGNSVGEQVLTGTLWMGSWRWSARLIGLLSTIITARLLLPDDFGIAATGMIVVAFFDILTDLGTDNYLVRLPNAQSEDYDTAWTLRLIVVSAASIVIFLAAAPGATLFGDSRLTDVIRTLAFASLLRGFTNIGLSMYRRDMQFGRIALIGLGQRMIGFITTVILAVMLRNYWAVIIGEVAFHAAGLVLSYVFHSYRPRICMKQIGKQWEFCKWIVARNIAVFMQGRGDQFVVAKFFGIEKIGLYTMAIRFAELPTKHFMAPMLMPVYAALAKKQEEPEQFSRSVLQVIGATFAVALPAATLLATLSEEFVGAILGSKWESSVPLVAPMIFSLMAAVLSEPAVTTLTLSGRVRLLAALHWLSAASVVIVMLSVAQWNDLELLVLARVVLAFAILLYYYRWMRLTLHLSWGRLFMCIYRPCIATIALACATTAISATDLGAWVTIILGTILGGLVYIAVLYGLWRVAASPASGEALLAQKSWKLLARVVGR